MNHRAIFNNKSTVFYSVLFLLLAGANPFFIAGCDRLGLTPGTVVMVIGNQQLTADDLKQDMVFAGEDLPVSAQDAEEMKTRLLDHIIDRYLMLEYARGHGIEITAEEFQTQLSQIKEGYTDSGFEQVLLRKSGDPDTWAKRLKEQLIIEKVIASVTRDMAPPDYKEIRAYFESAPNRFKAPEKVKFRQIVCPTRKQARQLHARIRAGENLADLAREYSMGPEAENGGDVGWIPKGTLDETLDKTLFSMAPGDVSPVTKGASGYHILEVISHRPGGFQEFSEVIGHIEQELSQQRRASFCREWLQNLHGNIRVKINQKAIDKLEFS